MKRLALFGILGALLFVALFVVNYQRQQSPAYILAQYPQTTAFLSSTRNLQDAPTTAIFNSVWFVDGRDYRGIKSGVDARGQVFTVRHVYNWTYPASHRLLTPA